MIELRALGPAHLAGPEGTDTGAVLARPKLLGLLAFLCAGGRGFHRRDSLIGCFWPELSQDRARSAVRQSLYRLRQSLGEGVIVTRGDDEVAVSEESFWSDVAAFEDALTGGDRARALELYRGDLLEGFYVPDAPEFERWLDERRKELRHRASTAAWELADQEAGQKNTVAAGRWSRHARNLAPLDERLLRRVIKLLDRLGDRAGAVREYETFARRLALELELEPSPETKALIERVRERSEPAPHQPSRPHRDPAVESPLPPTAPPQPLPTGVFADRYRLEQEIGAGGMATVYRARDLRHDRDVAVKVMYPDLSAHVGAERFLREIKIAASLTHPHIVPVFDSGAADGRLFFVMPLIEGETLRDRLTRDGQLPLDEALGYARDVAEALDYAHGRGVVHRDIKPENILLADGHALVADFGIARAVSLAAGGETRLTQAGLVIGTPVYMSPEQAVGSGAVDHRSDLYSLACVVYEMLGGQPPFTGPTAEVVARQHMSSAPRPITELRPTAPPHVSAAIARALEKAPADRFSQVNQFAQALVTPGALNLSRWKRRRIAWLVAGPVGLVVVVGLVTRLGQGPALNPNRVVVLPFENRTGDLTLTLLGSMAADWITQGLQEIEVIDVVPTATGIEPGPRVGGVAESSSLSNARAAGEVTNAGTVVAGSYYLRGDSLEFHAQVIDADAQRLLRAVTPLAAPAAASGALLDSLRARVVSNVAAALDHRLMGSPASNRPPSLAAYRAYVEGHRAFYHAGPMRMREVLEFMYQAVALDSTFPDPRFFIVMAHWNLGERGAADSNAQLLLPFRPRLGPRQRAWLDWLIAGLRGDRAGALRAQRARGGPDLAVETMYSNRPRESVDILTSLEDLSIPEFYFKWDVLMEALHMVGDHRRELDQARRARGVYPDRLLMLRNELRARAALGQLDEVEHGLEEGLLVPGQGEVEVWDFMLSVGAELRAHGYRETALRVAERTLGWLESRPQDQVETLGNRMARAMALYAAERWEDARAAFQDLSVAMPGDVNVHGYLGVLAARRGDRDEAIRISTRLVGMAGPYEFGRDVYWRACIAAQLRELDQAMALLRDAYNRGRPFGIRLHRDMDLESLHGYPPFEEFLEPKG